jgi:AmmeMemoRadiSam system protein A
MTEESRLHADSALDSLSEEERGELLRLARQAVGAALGLADPPVLHVSSSALLAPGAAFVSIYVDEHLRGCVGTLRRDDPLHATVARVARSAAVDDPRFPALAAPEWTAMEVEISRLSPLVCAGVEDIEPGLHGLCVAQGQRQGLLLPQVAGRFGWTRERFLDETCSKAGLAREAWRDPQTRVQIFTAEVFRDPRRG